MFLRTELLWYMFSTVWEHHAVFILAPKWINAPQNFTVSSHWGEDRVEPVRCACHGLSPLQLECGVAGAGNGTWSPSGMLLSAHWGHSVNVWASLEARADPPAHPTLWAQPKVPEPAPRSVSQVSHPTHTKQVPSEETKHTPQHKAWLTALCAAALLCTTLPLSELCPGCSWVSEDQKVSAELWHKAPLGILHFWRLINEIHLLFGCN